MGGETWNFLSLQRKYNRCLDDFVMLCVWRVLSEVYTQILKTGDPLHRLPSDGEGGVPAVLLPPEVHHHSLCLGDILGQIVGLTPQCQACHLVLVGLLVVFGD